MIRAVQVSDIVEQYVESVLNGDIRACKATIQAIEKYKREIVKQNTADFPFVFDATRANIMCSFFPMLLRHSIGEFAGEPFHLSPWQMFVVWNVFGWKRRDGTRRFRRVFLSLGRKNGKSTFCAGLAIELGVADGEQGSQVFIGATKLDQARIIHQESTRMLNQSPHIHKHATIFKDNIAFDKSNSYIRPLGSDKPFDGLNPHGVFFDELHAWSEHHRSFFDTMTTGSGSRTQPLQVTITTAGNEKSRIYNEEAAYARGVLDGGIVDNTLFAMIFELDKDDDPFDEGFEFETLQKANPNLGISIKPDYLQQQLTEAKNKPQAKSRFMRYHGNRCVSSVEDCITAEIWDACSGPLSDWRTSQGVGAGFDLGGRDDLASYCLAAKFKIGEEGEQDIYRYEVKSISFIAEDTKRDLTVEPFATWIQQGKLVVCRYVIGTLKEYLLEDCILFGVEFIAYDPYQATHLAEELEGEGLTPVKMPQTHSHFNEPITSYQQEVSEGRFKPDENDEVLRWCALNMALNRNSKDQVMPDKKHSKEKIDAAVAMLMSKKACALARAGYDGPLVF